MGLKCPIYNVCANRYGWQHRSGGTGAAPAGAVCPGRRRCARVGQPGVSAGQVGSGTDVATDRRVRRAAPAIS